MPVAITRKVIVRWSSIEPDILVTGLTTEGGPTITIDDDDERICAKNTNCNLQIDPSEARALAATLIEVADYLESGPRKVAAKRGPD